MHALIGPEDLLSLASRRAAEWRGSVLRIHPLLSEGPGHSRGEGTCSSDEMFGEMTTVEGTVLHEVIETHFNPKGKPRFA